MPSPARPLILLEDVLHPTEKGGRGVVVLSSEIRDRSDVHARDCEDVFVLKGCSRSIGRQSVTRSGRRVVGRYVAHNSVALRDFLDDFDKLNMLSAIAGCYKSLHLPYPVWGAWHMERSDDRWI